LVHGDQTLEVSLLHANTTTVEASATSLQLPWPRVTEKPKVLPWAHASGEPFFSYAMIALLLVHVPPSRSMSMLAMLEEPPKWLPMAFQSPFCQLCLGAYGVQPLGGEGFCEL